MRVKTDIDSPETERGMLDLGGKLLHLDTGRLRLEESETPGRVYNVEQTYPENDDTHTSEPVHQASMKQNRFRKRLYIGKYGRARRRKAANGLEKGRRGGYGGIKQKRSGSGDSQKRPKRVHGQNTLSDSEIERVIFQKKPYNEVD